MPPLVRIAARNVLRNRRRSLITFSAVFLALTVMVSIRGLVNGLSDSIRQATILGQTGSLQVHRRGFLKSMNGASRELDVPTDAVFMNKLRAVPGVADATARIYKVCPKRATSFAKGGRPLGQDDNNGALVGKAIAESLNLQPGSTAIMQAAGAHVGVNALDLSVVGFLPSLHPAEAKRVATVELGFAQELLRMKGSVTEYVVGIGDVEDADEIAGKIRKTLGGAYQVTTWKEMDP